MLVDAIRSLRRAPGITLFILIILTLTISAATVTFSVVDAVVLRPLPFEEPDRLVAIDHQRGDRVMAQVRVMTAIQYLTLRERMPALSGLAAVRRGSHTLQSGDDQERILSATVTASLFDVLRVRPLLGARFTAAHDVADSDRVALISHGLWSRRFGRDTSIVGRTIVTSERPLVVLGVMPEHFSYPISDDRLVDVWVPYVIPEDERAGKQPSAYLHLVGRLAAGASQAQAQAQADAVRKTLAEAEPDRYTRAGRFAVTPLKDSVVGTVRGWMLLALIAVALLLLVACANVANLLLSRALFRARELSIRAALGATRARLVTLLLTESLVLSIIAVALALVISWWGIAALKAALPPGIARANLIALDFRVFTAAVGAALLTGLLFGVIPALQASRGDLVALIKPGGSTVTSGRSRWRSSVLVAEIACASVLLVATTLVVSSFIRLTRADLGFQRSRLLVVSSLTGLQGSVTDFVQRLESIPGVEAVGGAAAGSPPLVAAGFEGGSSGMRFSLPETPAEFVGVEFNRVSSHYFQAASIPVLRGRVFEDSDPPTSNAVVLDDLAARQLFGDRDPVGRELTNTISRFTVIGVVANVRMRGPEAETSPQAYFQGPAQAGRYSYIVRTSQPAATVIPALQTAIASLRPEGSTPAQIRRVEDAFRNITARRRFSAGTMAIFGMLALVIGAAGVYGVMSSLVAQRTREIGVRLALGATGSQIVSAVLGQMGRHVALGLVLGLLVAWLASTAFAAFFMLRPTDLWIYAAVASLLSIVGFAAAFIPARRASRVDPLLTLRAE